MPDVMNTLQCELHKCPRIVGEFVEALVAYHLQETLTSFFAYRFFIASFRIPLPGMPYSATLPLSQESGYLMLILGSEKTVRGGCAISRSHVGLRPDHHIATVPLRASGRVQRRFARDRASR